MTIDDWTQAHRDAAQAEGWDIFETFGLEEGYRVERIDYPEIGEPLESDEEAWRIIHRGIVRGSALHLHAAAVISVLNPEEYNRIISA